MQSATGCGAHSRFSRSDLQRQAFTCAWTSPQGQPIARVDVTVSTEELLLEWPGGSQRVAFVYTWRHPLPSRCSSTCWVWFLCPGLAANGEPCGRHVVALYRSDNGPYFACRFCGHLIYASHSESASERSIRRARKARLRLAKAVHAAPDANLFDLFPARPPWKYRRVYARLLSAAQRAVERCWELQQPGRPTQGRDAKGRHLPIVMPDK